MQQATCRSQRTAYNIQRAHSSQPALPRPLTPPDSAASKARPWTWPVGLADYNCRSRSALGARSLSHLALSHFAPSHFAPSHLAPSHLALSHLALSHYHTCRSRSARSIIRSRFFFCVAHTHDQRSMRSDTPPTSMATPLSSMLPRAYVRVVHAAERRVRAFMCARVGV